MNKILSLCCLIVLFFMTTSSISKGHEIDPSVDGLWISVIPKKNAFEGVFHNAIQITGQDWMIGRMVSIVEENNIVGHAIPANTFSQIEVIKKGSFADSNLFAVKINLSKFVMMFKKNELFLIDADSNELIEVFRKQDDNAERIIEIVEQGEMLYKILNEFSGEAQER